MYADPAPTPWVEALRAGTTSVVLPDGTRWLAVDRMDRATPRRQDALDEARDHRGDPGKDGGRRRRDRPQPDGRAFISPWPTRVDLDDLEPAPWPQAGVAPGDDT